MNASNNTQPEPGKENQIFVFWTLNLTNFNSLFYIKQIDRKFKS